jgi:Flp pilus assembly protein TadG
VANAAVPFVESIRGLQYMYPEHKQIHQKGERGSVIVMVAIFMSLLLLMIGLCIDVSRIYLTRTELQNAADAAALTAAHELNGGTTGIDNAVTRANAIINTQGLRTKSNVTIATVEFAVNLDGPYWAPGADTTANAASITFVRVTTQTQTTSILFALSALGSTHTESRTAVAGKSVDVNGICDFFPAAVALSNPSPSPGTLMTLNFNQGTGNSAVLVDKDYIILEVPDINGNGTVETALLTAGLRTYCKSLGDNINMTPSSNQNNGPRNAADGMNTRFGIYANGYGNLLQPGTFPSDTNVQQNISASDYLNGSPAGNSRRMLVMAIINPGTYPAYTTNIQGWGVFFLKTQSPAPQGNCSSDPTCGSIPVEYVGKAEFGTVFGDPSCGSGLTTAVLYK